MGNKVGVEYESRLNMVRKVFDKIDINRDGYVTIDELEKFLGVPRKEIIKGINKVDYNKDGRIDFREFVDFVSKTFLSDFKFFDKDKSGLITLDEMKQAFEKLGKTGAEKYLKELDLNGDGTVSLDEYIVVCLKIMGWD
eukprot:TRINITY_DN10080_c0_g1_i1.p1 TRINITY_DN10080_c0_g1~~TRINITY_DN10080_c0_g1_i1.p1  ORF type:complete len:139 (+),score=23.67 TRINITY_DN10080_c0_g1_i1:38-454(+)